MEKDLFMEGGDGANGFEFKQFYAERCRHYNQAYGAPPGVHLPEAGASALNDFIQLSIENAFLMTK